MRFGCLAPVSIVFRRRFSWQDFRNGKQSSYEMGKFFGLYKQRIEKARFRPPLAHTAPPQSNLTNCLLLLPSPIELKYSDRRFRTYCNNYGRTQQLGMKKTFLLKFQQTAPTTASCSFIYPTFRLLTARARFYKIIFQRLSVRPGPVERVIINIRYNICPKRPYTVQIVNTGRQQAHFLKQSFMCLRYQVERRPVPTTLNFLNIRRLRFRLCIFHQLWLKRTK